MNWEKRANKTYRISIDHLISAKRILFQQKETQFLKQNTDLLFLCRYNTIRQ